MPQPEDALAHCRYYMTLMRDDYLQVRVGECAYVTREGSTIDIMAFNNQRSSHLIRDQLDIFRVERLWRKYRFKNCLFVANIYVFKHGRHRNCPTIIDDKGCKHYTTTVAFHLCVQNATLPAN